MKVEDLDQEHEPYAYPSEVLCEDCVYKEKRFDAPCCFCEIRLSHFEEYRAPTAKDIVEDLRDLSRDLKGHGGTR